MVVYADMRKRHEAEVEAYLTDNAFNASGGFQFIEGMRKLGVPLERDVVRMVGHDLYMLADRVDGWEELTHRQIEELHELFGHAGFRSDKRNAYVVMRNRHVTEAADYTNKNAFIIWDDDECESFEEQFRKGVEKLGLSMEDASSDALELVEDFYYMSNDKAECYRRLLEAQYLKMHSMFHDRDFLYEVVAQVCGECGYPTDCDLAYVKRFVVPGAVGMTAVEVADDPRFEEAFSDVVVVAAECERIKNRYSDLIKDLSPVDGDETFPEPGLDALCFRIMADDNLDGAFDDIAEAAALAIVSDDYGQSTKVRFMDGVQKVISKNYGDAVKTATALERLTLKVCDTLKDRVYRCAISLMRKQWGPLASASERDYILRKVRHSDSMSGVNTDVIHK
jgi:hypothetical protein